MHWTLTLIGLAVAWALLGGLWRPGSVALAVSWMIGQATYVATGESLPITLYWIMDPLVLLIIWRYRATVLDLSIMATFPVQWGVYLTMSGAEQWWWLWTLTVVQLVLAGPWPALQKGRAWSSHGPLRTGNLP